MITEAGNRGPDVRSDCWVGLDPEADAGFEIRSKVEALFGESLAELVSKGIERLELLEHQVRVEDQGALPWVIMARLEAAARAAAGGNPEPYLPDRTRPLREPRPDRMLA
jgi:citrate lyase subunit beta/citryl-CoA lyase